MTRMEAAERAAIDELLTWAKLRNGTGPLGEASLYDAAIRVRDLREQTRAEECGAKFWDDPYKQTVTCHLLRGHEMEHEGSLGLYVWID